MCGIIGGWWRAPSVTLDDDLRRGLAALAHRGPDDRGTAVHHHAGAAVGLGHSRLSIIDLSPGGHQPMRSADGRHAIVFNGEIYNYRELRRELAAAGVRFSSRSDTEVLLAAWAAWGPSCLRRLVGMFAFAIHDRAAETLTCVRDAFGIKPFFYDQAPDRFVFGSETRCLSALTGERPELDWQRAHDYLVFGDYDSGERTFLAGVRHLPPGHSLVLDCRTGLAAPPTCWWEPPTDEGGTSFADAADRLRELFLDSVRMHLRSDVPLGATLSGGLDSAAVVCAMRHVEPDLPIHTFSYAAQGTPWDEDRWARLVNDRVGATPHRIVIDPADLADDIDELITCQGEPFMSTSVYAQYRVFREARQRGIVVTLDGQGADESLAGYAGYPGPRTLSLVEQGRGTHAIAFTWRWSTWPGRRFSEPWRYVLWQGMPAAMRRRLGRRHTSDWIDPRPLAEAGVDVAVAARRVAPGPRGRRLSGALHEALTSRYLPALLRHVDRSSMRFSIESRVPFLTLPLVEHLLVQREEHLVSEDGETKHLFREAMRDIVPDAIRCRRDKIGFQTPESGWLRRIGPRVEEWLAGPCEIPFLRTDRIQAAVGEMVAGRRGWTPMAWRFVNFIRWMQLFDVGSAAPRFRAGLHCEAA